MRPVAPLAPNDNPSDRADLRLRDRATHAADMEIPRRNVDLAFEGVPRDWCNGDAYETTFMNALSLLFPEGEQFFVRTVKAMQDRITDPDLARDVVGFIGQEATHGREHRDFNDMLVGHGF